MKYRVLVRGIGRMSNASTSVCANIVVIFWKNSSKENGDKI